MSAAKKRPAAKDGVLEILDFDPNTLTFGELERIEDMTGMGPAAVLDGFAKPPWSAKLLAAVVWVLKSRADPTVTFEDVRALGMSDLVLKVAPPDPTPAGVEAGESPPPA